MRRLADLRWDWLGPAGIACLALALRMFRLQTPNRLVFDETYYAKDAYSLTKFGYVQEYVKNANDLIPRGQLKDLWTGDPSWIVHPDGGKWVIALGEWLFGMNSFGWRVSAAVVGSLTVFVLARLILRLTGSTWIACVGGLLLTFDGMHFVMSRTALLDIFLTFWLVCAVACLVADHDWMKARIDRLRPWRPWQLAAGLCFGMALSTKWSALWVIASFGVLMVVWELAARGGPGEAIAMRTILVGLPAFVTIVGVALVVYVASWTGWFVHVDAYEQRFGLGYGNYSKPWGSYVTDPTGGPFGPIIDAIRSFYHFHAMTLNFHTKGLNSATHPYQSNPIGWLVLDRPVAFDVVNDVSAEQCGTYADSSCIREVTAIGNPAVWWTGTAAFLGSFVAWGATLDKRWSIPILGILATWAPWFLSASRPIFSFYAVATLPFLIIGICLLLDLWRRHATSARSRYGLGLFTGVLLVATVTLFCYFYPVLADVLISRDAWQDRMWFSRWI